MKNFLFKVFNLTFGSLIRGIQMTLVNRTPIQGLHDKVTQMAIHDAAEYVVRNFSRAMVFNTREELWDYCLSRNPSLQVGGGVIAEFGVWKGESINFFARKCPKARIYGFDSFEGLEEDFYGFVLLKGSFSTAGKLPKCEKNVELYKGWFEDTLPSFIDKLGKSQIHILHMDADTYKPTAYVLNSLSKNLSKGTIIIFDEYFGHHRWRLHEFKAWQEAVEAFDIKYIYLCYTEGQVAVEIL